MNGQRITLISLTVSPAKAAYISTPQLEVQRSMQRQRAPLQWQGIVREPKSSPDRRRILGYISPSTLVLILISQPLLTTTTKHSSSPLPSNNMYKFAVAIVAAFAVFFGQASAATLLADNPGEFNL